VGFLVGWAFNVAASANLPAIVMLLFWRHTTRKGMIAAIVVGTVSSLAWLLLTKEAFQLVYYIKGHPGLMPFSQPGLVTIPLGFIVLIVVSLLTENKREPEAVRS
jgi:cation/acetate symporter